MKWFYDLEKSARIFISVSLFAFFIIFISSCDPQTGLSLDFYIFFSFLLLSVFAFFAIHTAKSIDLDKKSEEEKRAEEEKRNAPPASQTVNSHTSPVAFQSSSHSDESRSQKGDSLLSFPDSYVVIDIETTGLSPENDSIIEIAAIRYSCDIETDRFSCLINPHFPLPSFISDITGITDEMLFSAPDISKVLPAFHFFIGDSVLVGHNVNFDINFLYDKSVALLDQPISNDFVDTLRIARRCKLPVENNRLPTLVDFFVISEKSEHRALADCVATQRLLICLRQYVADHQVYGFKKAKKGK